ncbi:MAG: ferrochelatase [Deltaproteobacteria bacterium]|nr:ferrochelatase [Deltaproteobacteria bacterium]
MPAAAPPAPPNPAKVGILLVNTGTPDSPSTADVRRYLRQFLGDPRVLDMPALARWLLLELIILPSRPAKSAHAYRAIWTEQGSPLRLHGHNLAQLLENELDGRAAVRLAFQYGNPSIPSAMDELATQGIDQLVAVPLFPHYAAASFGSAAAAVMAAASERWVVPCVHVVPPFWHEPEFLDAVAQGARAQIAEFRPDHVLLSYHGVPERHCTRTDTQGETCHKRAGCCDSLGLANRNCYRAQCFATSRALIDQLGLDPAQVTTAFQSRLGKVPWIRPYADEKVLELARRGVKKLLVLEPSFVADCLETLEEIGIRAKADFEGAGGSELRLVPSLNSSNLWVRGLAQIVRTSAAGWLPATTKPTFLS